MLNLRQATKDYPNIEVKNIKCPAIVSSVCVLLGFIVLGYGAVITSSNFTEQAFIEIKKKIELCESLSSIHEKHIKCLKSIPIKESDYKELSPENRRWLKCGSLELC